MSDFHFKISSTQSREEYQRNVIHQLISHGHALLIQGIDVEAIQCLEKAA